MTQAMRCATKTAESKAVCQRPTRPVSGPRTPEGKRRSKYNAITHGLFASVVLEDRESKEEYRRLLRSLREDIRPQGALEGLLVGKLAMLFWRTRRVLAAERAEILKGADFVDWDKDMDQFDELKETDDRLGPLVGGLLRRDRNPLVLDLCLMLLREWRKNFLVHGFDLEGDLKDLTRIYGQEELGEPRGGLPFAYRLLHRLTVEGDKEEGEAHRSPEKCKSSMLKYIDKEVTRLAGLKQELEEMQSKRLTHEAETHLVPIAVDRLIRYETMLSREIDKTLNQLEHLQRRRQGEKDLPPIKLDLSI